MTSILVVHGRQADRRPRKAPATPSLVLLAAVSTPVALLFTLAAAPVGAQQLEEVVVTARKTEERLQDVPLSIAAFSSEDIRQSGARDLYDLTRFTPGSMSGLSLSCGSWIVSDRKGAPRAGSTRRLPGTGCADRNTCRLPSGS